MILLVLSDCIGFIAIIPLFHTLEKRSSRVALPGWTSSRKVCKPSSTWSVSPFPLFYGVVTHNVYGSFSLRETMLSLKQPYIEWSDGILSTGYHPIDRQHEWLLTIVNISTWRWWLMIDDWWLCLHETFWSMWTRGIKRISAFMTCWTRWAIMCGSTLPMRKPSLWIIHILVKMKWMMCYCCEYDEYCGYTQLLL